MRAAAGDQRLREFLKLSFGFVSFGQFGRQRVELRPAIAQKIKVQRLAIEQMLDIEQDGGRR